MTIEQIIELAKVGFTPEQIVALAGVVISPASETQQGSGPEPNTPPDPGGQQENHTRDDMSAIRQQLDTLQSQIQSVFRFGASNPAPQEESLADIAAHILTPNPNRGGN